MKTKQILKHCLIVGLLFCLSTSNCNGFGAAKAVYVQDVGYYPYCSGIGEGDSPISPDIAVTNGPYIQVVAFGTVYVPMSGLGNQLKAVGVKINREVVAHCRIYDGGIDCFNSYDNRGFLTNKLVFDSLGLSWTGVGDEAWINEPNTTFNQDAFIKPWDHISTLVAVTTTFVRAGGQERYGCEWFEFDKSPYQTYWGNELYGGMHNSSIHYWFSNSGMNLTTGINHWASSSDSTSSGTYWRQKFDDWEEPGWVPCIVQDYEDPNELDRFLDHPICLFHEGEPGPPIPATLSQLDPNDNKYNNQSIELTYNEEHGCYLSPNIIWVTRMDLPSRWKGSIVMGIPEGHSMDISIHKKGDFNKDNKINMIDFDLLVRTDPNATEIIQFAEQWLQ